MAAIYYLVLSAAVLEIRLLSRMNRSNISLVVCLLASLVVLGVAADIKDRRDLLSISLGCLRTKGCENRLVYGIAASALSTVVCLATITHIFTQKGPLIMPTVVAVALPVLWAASTGVLTSRGGPFAFESSLAALEQGRGLTTYPKSVS